MTGLVIDSSATSISTALPSTYATATASYFTDLRRATVNGYKQENHGTLVSAGPSQIVAVGDLSNSAIATSLETEDLTTPTPTAHSMATTTVANYKSLKYAILLSGIGALTLVL
ncbi:uncharacterized protein SPAPADRAFT_61195 [Spathaspora passalidarum NRRL Y-27907]|uniref:Uncharacterized protein n=1 Tax=Spathaspora passalidarum (strain NRRL Y-27907 / 11-Y1) TaxID=619300 RepID=G3APD7_SPAPN|nr:uncharacterized protein SPAPADRAFT_61195 [Spathaspora passalidarum NRRL Y-27907]EGW32114.1 hypothetical protein SPAPADRAFT_61195 [Spathaspora passalidarum NRRL Y-27907]